MTPYRIVRTDPYANREDEYRAETIEAAAIQADEFAGIGADLILSDIEEGYMPYLWTDPETGVELEIRKEA